MATFAVCPECGVGQIQRSNQCASCGHLLGTLLFGDQALSTVLELLNDNDQMQWKMIASNADFCYLLTTEKPVVIPVEGPKREWGLSQLRRELNSSFIDCLPSEITQILRFITYTHGNLPRNNYQPAEDHVYDPKTPMQDRVILLDTSEAKLIPSYKPNDCRQEIWNEWLAGMPNVDEIGELVDFPCTEGLMFNTEGMDARMRAITIAWAREQLQSEMWPGWLLLRDSKFFRSEGTEAALRIPNGVHPVICVDLSPVTSSSSFADDVDISSFLGLEPESAGYETEWKTRYLRSRGLITSNELVVSEREYNELKRAKDESNSTAGNPTPNVPSMNRIPSVYDDDIPF